MKMSEMGCNYEFIESIIVKKLNLTLSSSAESLFVKWCINFVSFVKILKKTNTVIKSSM
jgi:hypothetical protein